MKKVTSALALAALVGSPSAFALSIEFGGDFDANAYATHDGEANELATGSNQRMRLATSVETEGGVEVHARLNLFNDRWTGDGSGVSTEDETPFSARNHRNVELDYGYLTMPTGIGQLTLGRVQSNWNNNFTTSDDRRDRIALSTPLGGGHTLITAFDRRSAPSDTDRQLEGNQPFLALLGPLADGVNYGVLVAHWEAGGSGGGNFDPEPFFNDDGEFIGDQDDFEDAEDATYGYALRGATLVSPYVAGEAGDFDYRIGGHYIGGSRGSAYTEDTLGGYIQLGLQMTPEFKLEGQVFHAADGNLIAAGYDSYSSLIHNSPDHNQTPTRIAGLNLGGSGTEAEDGDSTTLVAVRGTYAMMDWTFMGAAGWVNYDRNARSGFVTDDDGDVISIDPADRGEADEDVVFLDLQAHYQVTDSTKVWATAGYAQTDDYFDARFGSDRDSYATSLNIQTQF